MNVVKVYSNNMHVNILSLLLPLLQRASWMLLLITGYVASARGGPWGPHKEEHTAAGARSQVLIQAH